MTISGAGLKSGSGMNSALNEKPRTGGTPRLLRFQQGGTSDGEGMTPPHCLPSNTVCPDNFTIMKVGLTPDELASAGSPLPGPKNVSEIPTSA